MAINGTADSERRAGDMPDIAPTDRGDSRCPLRVARDASHQSTLDHICRQHRAVLSPGITIDGAPRAVKTRRFSALSSFHKPGRSEKALLVYGRGVDLTAERIGYAIPTQWHDAPISSCFISRRQRIFSQRPPVLLDVYIDNRRRQRLSFGRHLSGASSSIIQRRNSRGGIASVLVFVAARRYQASSMISASSSPERGERSADRAC